jgi:hypothetical protein
MAPANVIAMARLIVSELEIAVPAVSAAAGIGGGATPTVQKVVAALADAQQALAALQTVDGDARGVGLIDRIDTDAQTILAVAAGLPLSPSGAVAVRVAQMVVPMLAGMAQVIWPAAPLSVPISSQSQLAEANYMATSLKR